MPTCWSVSCQLYGSAGDDECEADGHTDVPSRVGSEAGCYS
jgi:hypothetical protein